MELDRFKVGGIICLHWTGGLIEVVVLPGFIKKI